MPKPTNEQKEVMHVITSVEYPVRLSYAHLFQQQQDSGKYQTKILIPKEDKETIAKIQAAMKVAVDVKFGGNFPQGGRTPLRDGDIRGPNGVPDKAEEGKPPYGGHFFMTVKSDYPPEVVDQAMRKITSASQIVSGDYARVSMNAFGYNTKGEGVSFGLANVQLIRKGEPLGDTGRPASKEFAAIPTDTEAVAGGDNSGEAADPTRPFG